MTGFAKGALRRTIINIKKSYFEILNTVYLKNAWCPVYVILHQSIVVQDNLIGALELFTGLLAELPTSLGRIFTSTTSNYIGMVGREWWGAMKWWGKNMKAV